MIAPVPGLRVCVYCASSTYDPELPAIATGVGEGTARHGRSLVSGGGNVSMTGAVAEAAGVGGARTVGVIPEGLRIRELADTAADELVVITMRERKRGTEERSDAFLIRSGGIGTLEEMIEMWTSASPGFHREPVVLYDPIGFYRPLPDRIGRSAEAGLVDPEACMSPVGCDDLEAALDAGGGRR